MDIGGRSVNYFYPIIKTFFVSFIFFVSKISINNPSIKENIEKSIIKKNTIIINKINEIKDILFINGCNPKILPHPYRYRILHQIEQLKVGFLESDEFFYLDFNPYIVRNYRVIIFFRCPWTTNVEEAINLAKILNKKVLFDIDDLVFDTKYTEIHPYIKTLSKKEKKLYNEGVNLMGKTLKLCEGAITTTEGLAKELNKYVNSVYINRNVANEEMWNLSQNALMMKRNETKGNNIIIGYFSGSISHNPDIEIIKPVLIKILREFKNVKLLLFGLIDIPIFLKKFSSKIIKKEFIDWKQLPEVISSVDINIAPIEKILFNEAKSENKWVEASLVKVPTVASNYGAFKQVIQQNKTGILCSNLNDWYISLKSLINNELLRRTLGENAYFFCKRKYNTIYTGINLANYLNSISNRHIGFFLPSLKISGGVYVILKHASLLKDEKWDVDLIVPFSNIDIFEFEGHKFNIINMNNMNLNAQYDILVATLYTTLYSTLNYYKAKRHLYLVQGYETDFYPYGYYFRIMAEKTYSIPFNIEFITISKWCKKWLLEKYNKKARYAPNGIDFNSYKPHKRNLKKDKIRILIEGDSTSHYKNVDESFKIIEKLDNKKFEIWYLSYDGKPKYWYRIDRFFNEIPHEEVKKIYDSCDILLKSSWLESFSYPPLEMMATGGYCIIAPNDGNKEYLEDGKNCLLYKLGDINSAVKKINNLIIDEGIQQNLYENGISTAKNRDWNLFKDKIISLYDKYNS